MWDEKTYRHKYYLKNKKRIHIYKHKWYLKNSKKLRDRRKKRYQDNKERELKRNNIYKKKNIVKVRQIRLKNTKDYQKRYPEKRKAQVLSQNIKIPKKQPCELCKKKLAVQKHHPDYSKPLEVQFLCVQCHNDVHNNKIYTPIYDNLGGLLLGNV